MTWEPGRHWCFFLSSITIYNESNNQTCIQKAKRAGLLGVQNPRARMYRNQAIYTRASHEESLKPATKTGRLTLQPGGFPSDPS